MTIIIIIIVSLIIGGAIGAPAGKAIGNAIANAPIKKASKIAEEAFKAAESGQNWMTYVSKGYGESSFDINYYKEKNGGKEELIGLFTELQILSYHFEG